MVQKLGSIIKSIDAVHINDYMFELDERAPFIGNVFPETSKQVDRNVIIRGGAQVKGSIYGREVEICDGLSSKKEDKTRICSIFGREKVNIGKFCCIGGNITCGGEIKIGEYSVVLGNVIAPNVRLIRQGAKIYGNVISEKPLTIAENVHVYGHVVVLNGELVIGKNSKAYDILASDKIIIGEGVILMDPVVWSKEGKIEFSSVIVGKDHIVESNMSNIVKQGEINPYLESSVTSDYQEIIDELKSNLSNRKIACD